MKFSTILMLFQVVAAILCLQGLFVAFFYWRSSRDKERNTTYPTFDAAYWGKGVGQGVDDVYSAPTLIKIVEEQVQNLCSSELLSLQHRCNKEVEVEVKVLCKRSVLVKSAAMKVN